MPFGILKPILWIFCFLAVAEVSLEYRASRRGFRTILFGQSKKSASAQQESSNEIERPLYGPTDEFPFRSRVIDPGDHPDLRVWVASASHAEDKRQPPSDVFPSLLEQGLGETGIEVQVINASRAGNSISINQDELETMSGRWKPDIVILYQMSIDIVLLTKQEMGEIGGASGPTLVNEPLIPLGDYVHEFIENLTLYTIVKTNFSSRIMMSTHLANSLPVVAEDRFIETIDQFVDAAEQNGCQPVLCTFAMSHDLRNEDQVPTDYTLGMLRQNPHLSTRGWLHTVDRLNQRLREYGESHQIPVIDLARDIGGQPPYFRDLVHFSRSGHKQVASSMRKALEPIHAELTAE